METIIFISIWLAACLFATLVQRKTVKEYKQLIDKQNIEIANLTKEKAIASTNYDIVLQKNIEQFRQIKASEEQHKTN